MRSFFRALSALLFVLAASFSAGPLGAQELRELPGKDTGLTTGMSVSPKRSLLDGTALTAPRDVPDVSPSDVVIPPLPSSYITRDLGWMTLSFPPSASERVASLLKDAESVKAQLGEVLAQPVLGRLEIRITPTFESMKALSPVGAPPPAYASGVAYPKLRLVLISMMAPRGAEATNLDEVFRHELAHIALEDAARGHHVPAWFNEGLAVGFAGENGLDRQKVLGTATLNGTLLALGELDRGFPADAADVSVAYAESVDFLRFLQARSDRLRFAATIERVREGQAFDRALAEAYGSDIRKLEFQWRSEIERRYSLFPLLAGGGILWVGVIVALGWAYVKKRRRAKAILERWAVQEALDDALAAARALDARNALAVAQDEVDADLAGRGVRASTRSPVTVEHDGRWHTLH